MFWPFVQYTVHFSKNKIKPARYMYALHSSLHLNENIYSIYTVYLHRTKHLTDEIIWSLQNVPNITDKFLELKIILADSRIQIRIVEVEGKDSDHSTTTAHSHIP